MRRRASGVALAVGLNLLVLLALLTTGALPLTPPRGGQEPLIVSLIPDTNNATQAARSPQKPREAPVREQKPPLPKPKIVLPAKPTIETPRELPWIEMSKAEMAAADISRFPKGSESASAASAGDSEEVGRAPNGEVLYAADWARKPTNTELNGYLPPNAPDGWGLIACRTVAGNRVEDCLELGQSPRGSRLASAVRQAAWQFRVLPPRRNGRALIGSWVRIRIDYSSIRRS
jgi:periplasmic protein TonB